MLFSNKVLHQTWGSHIQIFGRAGSKSQEPSFIYLCSAETTITHWRTWLYLSTLNCVCWKPNFVLGLVREIFNWAISPAPGGILRWWMNGEKQLFLRLWWFCLTQIRIALGCLCFTGFLSTWSCISRVLQPWSLWEDSMGLLWKAHFSYLSVSQYFIKITKKDILKICFCFFVCFWKKHKRKKRINRKEGAGRYT